MKLKIRAISLGWILAASLLAAGPGVAQDPPHPPHDMMGGPGSMGGPGPMGGPMAEFGDGKTVKGAPLSADIVVVRETVLADGNRIHNESQSKLYRDAEGRVRRDLDVDLAMPAVGKIKHNLIVITDPVAGTRYMLNPDNKTGRTVPMHARTNHGDKDHEAQMKVMEASGGSVTREQLGTKSVNGIQAEGVRVTRTIPAGAMGNEKPINVVTERWYSQELQIAVMTVHTDPVMGTVTTKLVNLTQAPPDASLFQVPSDYTVRSGKPGDPMFMPARP